MISDHPDMEVRTCKEMGGFTKQLHTGQYILHYSLIVTHCDLGHVRLATTVSYLKWFYSTMSHLHPKYYTIVPRLTKVEEWGSWITLCPSASPSIRPFLLNNLKKNSFCTSVYFFTQFAPGRKINIAHIALPKLSSR